MDQEQLKKLAAEEACKYLTNANVIGVGTGSTVNYFIDFLAQHKSNIDSTVASSVATEQRLKAHGLLVQDLNSVSNVDIYIDGADEANDYFYLIKGRGGALTREKILATAAKKFICIIDESKKVDVLGKNSPVPIEVIPMARGYVARQLFKLGANPVYRENFITDNGNIILDVYNLKITDPLSMEHTLKNITGVVETGIFAHRNADILIIANKKEVITLKK